MDNNQMQAGLRVLVVEDETLIGALLEDMIAELGAVFVGPFATLAEALAAALRDDFDVALIDLNLRGERADAVAQRLAERDIPFALASGSAEVDPGLGQTVVLQKPFTFGDIEKTLQSLSRARGRRPG